VRGSKNGKEKEECNEKGIAQEGGITQDRSTRELKNVRDEREM
jgi:hypothetical protein